MLRCLTDNIMEDSMSEKWIIGVVKSMNDMMNEMCEVLNK